MVNTPFPINFIMANPMQSTEYEITVSGRNQPIAKSLSIKPNPKEKAKIALNVHTHQKETPK